MQRVAVGGTITLEATFTTGSGAVVDPNPVLVSVSDSADVERVSNAAPVRLAAGRYAFTLAVPADAPRGPWTIRWEATISGAPVSGLEVFEVIAAGAATPTVVGDPLVTVAQLAVYASLPALTPEQSAATQAHLDGLVAGLERALNRPLSIRTFREVTTTTPDGRVILTMSPVVEILSVAGVAAGSTLPLLAYRYAANSELEVTYRAGLDGSVDRHVRAAVMDKALPFVKTLLADAASSAASTGAAGLVVPSPPGGVKTFSVEGLNVTYESATDRSAAALKAAAELASSRAWTDEELVQLGLSRLRKRVVA